MHDDRDSRLARLHEQVADQAVTTQRLRLESKELRAAASAVLDEAVNAAPDDGGSTPQHRGPATAHAPVA